MLLRSKTTFYNIQKYLKHSNNFRAITQQSKSKRVLINSVHDSVLRQDILMDFDRWTLRLV